VDKERGEQKPVHVSTEGGKGREKKKKPKSSDYRGEKKRAVGKRARESLGGG